MRKSLKGLEGMDKGRKEHTGVDVLSAAFCVGECAFHVRVWGCVGIGVDGLPDGEESVYITIVK